MRRLRRSSATPNGQRSPSQRSRGASSPRSKARGPAMPPGAKAISTVSVPTTGCGKVKVKARKVNAHGPTGDTRPGNGMPNTGRQLHPMGCVWRPRPESNRGARICSPLRSHSATRPSPERVHAPSRSAPIARLHRGEQAGCSWSGGVHAAVNAGSPSRTPAAWRPSLRSGRAAVAGRGSPLLGKRREGNDTDNVQNLSRFQD